MYLAIRSGDVTIHSHHICIGLPSLVMRYASLRAGGIILLSGNFVLVMRGTSPRAGAPPALYTLYFIRAGAPPALQRLPAKYVSCCGSDASGWEEELSEGIVVAIVIVVLAVSSRY